MNLLWSLMFLTIVLYETRCVESTKPLEFLSALISKSLEFANEQLMIEIEQAQEAQEGEYPIDQLNVYNNSSNNESNQQLYLGNGESTLNRTQNEKILKQNQVEDTKIINEGNSNIKTDAHYQEVHAGDPQSESDMKFDDIPIENVIYINDKLYNKLVFLKSKVEPLHQIMKILLEPIGQDSLILYKKDDTINSSIVEPINTVKSITMIEPITTVKPVTTSESISTVKPVTTSAPTTTINLVTTSESITTVKPVTISEPTTIVKPNTAPEPITAVTPVEPIFNLSKSIIPVKSGAQIPNGCLPYINCSPINIIQPLSQMPLPDQNIYHQSIPYHIWYNNNQSPLNRPFSYQPNNQYLPYPMATPNIYGSKSLTYNNVPYTETNYQNYETYYPPANQQISSISRPGQIDQMSHNTYGSLNPIYKPYPISYYTVPRVVRSGVPKNMVFPRSMETTKWTGPLYTQPST